MSKGKNIRCSGHSSASGAWICSSCNYSEDKNFAEIECSTIAAAWLSVPLMRKLYCMFKLRL